jgi:hypothetical protein
MLMLLQLYQTASVTVRLPADMLKDELVECMRLMGTPRLDDLGLHLLQEAGSGWRPPPGMTPDGPAAAAFLRQAPVALLQQQPSPSFLRTKSFAVAEVAKL